MKRAIASAHYTGKSHADTFALLQHHGAATRLLDVSWDPLIALWFASEERRATDSAVYAVDVTTARYMDPLRDGGWHSFIDGLAPAQLGIYQPSWDDVRMKAQRGAFIYGVADVAPDNPNSPPLGTRFIVPSRIRDEAVDYLGSHMNITAETIYPDFEGFARANGATQKPRADADLAAFG